MKAGACELVRHRLDGHDRIAFGFLALIKFFGGLAIANRKIGGFHKGPRQIAIAAFGIACAFLFSIRLMQTAHAAAIGGVASNIREAIYAAGFQ